MPSAGLLGYTSQGALDSTRPIFLAAVVFGLSTDYGVFLLARIKEAPDAGAPNDEAVPLGLERTGRIVTAAAVPFFVAIGASATSEVAFIKQLGVGTALAVLIDAHDRARPARAVTDAAARRPQLVGPATAAPSARAQRTRRGTARRGVTCEPDAPAR